MFYIIYKNLFKYHIIILILNYQNVLKNRFIINFLFDFLL